MTISGKILATHLNRQAVVYLRQSTTKQVQQNRESAFNQRALTERLRDLGWPEQQIQVIDEDQGRSGTETSVREGFQKLVADVGFCKVGIVMGYEVSRLSRNCADWHQLLELCGVFDTLIADTDGVYQPRDFNDRLLLGLKGTMSEAELHSIRLRLDAGRISKAKRGALAHHLPTGLLRTADGEVVLDPDVSVQQRIGLAFQKFLELGTIQKVLTYFLRNQLKLPRKQTSGIYAGQVLWKAPTSASLASMLKNPAYAGTFAYGRRIADPTRQVPGRPATGRLRQPRSAWIALVHDVYPAYVTWQQHEQIQEQIAENCQKMQERLTRKQAIRAGSALLTGLVRCGYCGRAMSVAYREKARYRYACCANRNQYGQSSCQCIAGQSIDEAVIEEFFTVLSPAQIDALEAAEAKQAARQHELVAHLEQDVQRLDFAAHRAERQYDCVDPENRLIAGTLEKRWEHALHELRQAEERLASARRDAPRPVRVPEGLREAFSKAGQELPTIWPSLTNEARKSLLRTLIGGVNLRREDDGTLTIRIVWRGGVVTEKVIRVRSLTLRGSPSEQRLASRLAELYDEGFSDHQIAEQLNSEGFMPCRADGFTSAVVRKIKYRYHIVSNYTKVRTSSIPGGYTVGEIAKLIPVDPSWIYRRLERGDIQITKDRRFGCYLFPRQPSVVNDLKRLKSREVLQMTVPEVHHNG
jgi:DNA invertase Pin-like site-specific DNA recombinase